MNIIVAKPVSAEDIFTWPITSEILGIHTTADGEISIPHTKAGKWPIVNPFGDDTTAEGSIWGIVKIGTEWVAGTIDWLRPGQINKNILPMNYGPGFKTVYDSYTGPKSGETVGYFVSTTARFNSRTINERSNVVWVKFGTDEQVSPPIDIIPIPIPIPEVPEVPKPEKPDVQLLILEELKTQTVILKLIAGGLSSLPTQINETFSKGVKIRF